MSSEILENTNCQHHCQECGSGSHNGDKFCRRCGTRRSGVTETYETPASLALTLGLDDAPTYATALLTTEILHRPISGPLVKSVTGSLHLPATAQLQSRFGKSLSLALTSLAIWLMILLLSPLDAYAAACVTVAR